MTDPEDELRRTLSTIADGSDPVHTPLAQVAGRARRIRVRRRLTLAAVAAAAVMIVAVPLGVASARHGGSTAPAVSQPGPFTHPTGPPRIGYAVGDVYVAPDGTRTRLQVPGALTSVTPYAGGWLATSRPDPLNFGAGSNYLTFLDSTGRATRRSCTSTIPVVSASYIAWTENAHCVGPAVPRTIHRARLDGTDDVSVNVRSDDLVGLIGAAVVYGSGDRVFLGDLEHSPDQVPGMTRAVGVVPGSNLLIGVDNSMCADEFVRADNGAVVRVSPAASISSPSPDGSYLLASGGLCYRRGPSLGSTILRTSTLKAVARIPAGFKGLFHRRPGSRSHQVAWEDDSNLLGVRTITTAHRHAVSAVFRIGLDGTEHQITPYFAPHVPIVLTTTP